MGSKIIEHKSPRNSRTMSSWIISVTTFNRENALESSGKWNGKINLLNLTDSLPLDGGKVVIGETIKLGYYTQSGINQNQDNA
jgi:ATP-binding cassette subfamily F protein uup